MAFLLSGSVITQSGTDANLSGLAGLTGVTVTTIAAASGTFQGIKQYTINSATKLQVDGILSHDPDSEILVLQRNDIDRPLTINGTYNYGSSASFRGGTVYQAGCGLVIAGYYTGTQRQFRDTEAGIYVSSTGTFNWKGATIFSGRSIISAGALNIEKAKFVPRCTNTATKDYSPRIGFQSGTGTLDGIQIEGGSGHFFGVTLGSATVSPFRNLDVVGNNDQASVIAPEPGDAGALSFGSQFLLVTDIQDLSSGNLFTSRPWQGRFIEFLNYAGGVSLKDQLSDKTNTSNNAIGAVLATKQLSVSFRDAAGAAVQGAKYYIAEESDGNEPPTSVNAAFSAEDISYLENPQSFLLTSDANGDTATAKLALYFGYKMTTSPMVDNVRTKGGANGLDAAWVSYLHAIGNRAVDVSGQFEQVEAITLVADLSITETTKTTVDAYTAIDTSVKFYDRAKAYLVDNYAGETATLVSRSGTLIDAGAYNVTIDATAASVFAFDGSTITIKASTYTGDMTTTGVITLANGAVFIGTRTDANGTVAPPKVATVSGITAGSRLQVYNVTTATEVVNEVVSGTSYTATYEEGTGYSEGDSIRLRLVYVNGNTAKLPYTTGAVVGATGWSVLATQEDDTVYNTIALDGSTASEFTADYPNVQVDISDLDGETRVDRLYSWFVYTQYTEGGIANWFGGIVAEDTANFKIVTSILDLKIDNTAATGVTFIDGKRLYRDDDASPLVASTSGGGSITLFAGKVFTSVVSTSDPVITGDISQVPSAVQSGMTAQGYTSSRAETLDDIPAIKTNTGLIPTLL